MDGQPRSTQLRMRTRDKNNLHHRISTRSYRLEADAVGHQWLGEAEPGKQFLIDGRQQVTVSLRQLDFLHRKVGVEIPHVGRRQL